MCVFAVPVGNRRALRRQSPLASAVAVMAARAVVCHPLGESLAHELPGGARRLIERNEELQRALVLPWVLLSATGALLWTACAILSLGRLLGRHACRQMCKPCAGFVRRAMQKMQEQPNQGCNYRGTER